MKKMTKKKAMNSMVIILVLIATIFYLYKRYNYSEFNQGLIQIVADQSNQENKVTVYDENEYITTLHDFTMNDIEKIGNMVYYLGTPGIYYQSLTAPEEIRGYKTLDTGVGSSIVTHGVGDQIFFNLIAMDKDEDTLCESSLEFDDVNCTETGVNHIVEIVYDDNHAFVLGENEVDGTNKIILEKYDNDLKLMKNLTIGDAYGQIGMLDSQYIFDINSDGLYVYEEGKEMIKYDLPEYKIDNEKIVFEDEFIYNGDYYFVTNNSLICIRDKMFEQPQIQTLFDQYLYYDYYNIYFTRGNQVVRHNLTSKQTNKIKIKDRSGTSATNYYVKEL